MTKIKNFTVTLEQYQNTITFPLRGESVNDVITYLRESKEAFLGIEWFIQDEAYTVSVEGVR